ncbi:MAG: AraC family transcriptional regulator [Defluviitaleaceae bacterium]|nr:AraC family transcriptional regulator [Defluviitaleaceae bacterium]
MNWIQNLSNAINYIEKNLTTDIAMEDVSNHAYSSNSHFQRIFHLVMGLTIGEYIRNRRLSLAAFDLLMPNSKIIDIAMRYGYETQESFSKAFTRFHGVSPSKIRQGQARYFHPLTINVTVKGGFDLPMKFVNEFQLVDWSEIDGHQGETLTAAEKYKRIVDWSRKARGKNPLVFDALTEWILDDSQWEPEKLAENEQILMQGVLARFWEQNYQLRLYLKELEPSGVVNAAVFKALDDFDKELSGVSIKELQEAVSRMFADFTAMSNRDIRMKIAGNKTGPTGTSSVEGLGFINHLKNCDAQVQWCLFMPGWVKHQQKGFQVENFEYKQMPTMRFIGLECHEESSEEDREVQKKAFTILNSVDGYKSGFDYDVLFMHHYGRGVDIEPWHGFWGRFMKADAPVPDGFVHFDLDSEYIDTLGLPFQSKFALATFSGDIDAMHKREGYDSDAMYDVTRNIILGQGVGIPYPEKYWTAEVFLEGHEKPGTAYMFSVV